MHSTYPNDNYTSFQIVFLYTQGAFRLEFFNRLFSRHHSSLYICNPCENGSTAFFTKNFQFIHWESPCICLRLYTTHTFAACKRSMIQRKLSIHRHHCSNQTFSYACCGCTGLCAYIQGAEQKLVGGIILSVSLFLCTSEEMHVRS